MLAGEFLGPRLWVSPLITMEEAPGLRDMVVPSTVMVPPGVSVDPPIMYVGPLFGA